MVKKISSNLIANLFILAFIAYGPWHDAFFKGGRIFIGLNIGSLQNITSSGILNLFWICGLTACLAGPLWESFKRHKPQLIDVILVGFPLITLFGLRTIDSPAIISIENSFFLSVVLLFVHRRNDLADHFSFTNKYLFPVFLISYGFAILLPLLVDGQNAFRKFEEITRFVGWVGEGTAISLCGLALEVLGSYWFLKHNSIKSKWFGLLAVGLGFVGIHLNLHRSALVTSGIFFGVLAAFSLRKQIKVPLLVFTLLTVICCLSFFTGRFAAKSRFSWARLAAPPAAAQMVAEETKDAATLEAEAKRIELVQSIESKLISSNGRIEIAVFLLEKIKGNYIFGLGPGATSRLIRIDRSLLPHQTTQAQNEYVRILVDSGLVGLGWFLFILLAFIITYRKDVLLGIFLSFCFCILTENFLLFPSFGYGPLFIVAALFSDIRIKDPERSGVWLKQLLYYFRNLSLLAFFAYGPWHDAYFKGLRVPLGTSFGPFTNITFSGIINLFWIVLISSLIIGPLLRSFRTTLPKLHEWAVIAFMAVVIANLRVIDSPAIIAVENIIFISLLMLMVSRWKSYSDSILLFRSYAFPVFILSYIFSILVPIIVDPSKAFNEFDGIWRFVGWVGEGTAIALCGWILVILGVCWALYRDKVREQLLGWFAVLLGVVGIQLNLNRTALVATVVYLFVVVILNRKKVAVWKTVLVSFLVVACTISFFSGRFADKSRFRWTNVRKTEEIKSPVQVLSGLRKPPEKLDNDHTNTIVDFDNHIIATNDRIKLAYVLLKNAKNNLFFGMGTGYVPRFICALKLEREWNSIAFQTTQSQNDYLRVLIEYGIFGLILFVLTGATLIYVFRGTHFMALMVSLCFAFFTENILVFPSFAYGPLLLVGFLGFFINSKESRPEETDCGYS